MKRNTFKLPNRLICDGRLSPSARKVGAVLYAHRNAFGFCSKSLATLAALSGLCAATVRKATEELTDAGYITATRTYRYLPRKGKTVYGKKLYQVDLRYQGGYTQIPREVLTQKEALTPSAFLIFLCLRMAAGNSSRAFPSIAKIERMAGIARSTVCRALHQIKAMSEILVLLCRKRNRTFAASSYHFTTVLTADQAVSFADISEPITQQGAAEEKPRRIWNILHSLIVKARETLRNLFPGRGVVPFLANNS